MAEAIKKIINQYAGLVLALVLGFLLVLNLLFKWSQITSYAADLGSYERNVIWGIQQIMLGKPLYSDPQLAPFAVIQYMPLYYHLMAWLGKLNSIDPFEAHSVYVLARGFNGLLCIFSAFLVFRMARKIFHVDNFIALGVSVFAFLLQDKFVLSGRPDALKAALFLSILYVLLQFPETRKRWVYFFSISFSVLAFLTKQDGLVFSGILPLVLLLRNSWKEFFAVSLISGLAVLGSGSIFFVFDPAFAPNVAGGLHNGISISWFVGAFGAYFSLMALLFSLALVLVFEFLFEKNWKLNVLAAAFICSFFPQIVFALKYGSGPNYFIECSLISCLFLAIWLQQRPFSKAFLFPASPVLIAIVALKLYFYVPSIRWFTAVFMNEEIQMKEQYETQKSIAWQIRNQTGAKNPQVLVCIKRQWEDHLTTLLPMEAISPARDVVVQVLNAQGKLNFSKLKSQIETGSVNYLVVESGQKPDFLKLDYGSYQLAEAKKGYDIWRPVLK